MNTKRLVITIGFGLLLLFLLFTMFIGNTEQIIISTAIIPDTNIRTRLDNRGYYLECEGDCEYFNSLGIDHNLRFDAGYLAVNYMYDKIYELDQFRLGPLQSATITTVVNK